MYLIEPVLKTYGWGSRDKLQRLFEDGPAAHVRGPLAEVWFSGHPVWPSMVRIPQRGFVALDEMIRTDPAGVLGGADSSRFGPVLPFLFKIISAERPLSLQVHPVSFRARAGFNQENRDRVPLESPRRSYRDPVEKNEMVMALEAFDLSVGFANLGLIRSVLAKVDHPLARRMLLCVDENEGKGLSWLTHDERVIRSALSLAVRGDVLACGGLSGSLERAVRAASDPRERAMLDNALAAARAFPDDPSVMALLLMNAVRLLPGQAMYVPAGTLHTYIGGTAAEIMTSSDTVLRAGMTVKPKSVDEALRVIAYDGPRSGGPLEASQGSVCVSGCCGADVRVMDPGVEEFMLTWCGLPGGPGSGATREHDTSRVDVIGRPRVDLSPGHVRVVLSVRGDVSCDSEDGRIRLRPGHAALVRASESIHLESYDDDGEAVVLVASPEG